MASNASGIFRFDVFLSFRGEDTRFGFTGNLWKALRDRGIRTFMDDEELRKGEEITPSLLNAIEGSRMAIVVLSLNYASSSFCLQELSKILDCCQKENGRSVWPVFYDVDPSDVRKLTGTYGEAMAIHEARSNDNMDGLMKWKEALHQVANLSGFHFKNGDGYEHKFIGKIVEHVSREIKPFTLPVADYLVGLESQKQNVVTLLNVGSDDEVHMVGIHGIGGIGKTTLALAVYNSIAHQFEGSCFLENISANSEKHGLTYLQKILLSEIVGEKEIELTSVRKGISIIQQRLRQKKVLLILDDVDKMEQLQAIAGEPGEPKWFCLGSRVLITTRDKGLLTFFEVERTYGVEELNKENAFELLKWKAFKSSNVSSSYADVLNRAVSYASGLPLALEVIGSHLVKKGVKEWESALERYERIPNKKIQEVLKVSFDVLEKEEKSVFLDIACYFRGYGLAYVERILHAHHGDNMKDHIRVLVEKSLIKISKFGNVTLHDLIEDMGKEIVRQESPEEPGKRSRLWYHKDVAQVLEQNMGTSKVEIMCLDSWVKLDGEAFKKMENLRTLMVRQSAYFEGPVHLPNSLRVLDWGSCLSRSLPFDFLPRKLVSLGDLFKKKLENMRVLNLCRCDFLTHIPDVSSLPNLEELLFEHCRHLTTIDDSIGLLDRLKILKVDGCKNLRSFPPLKMKSLEELSLSQCVSLESFPPGDWLLCKVKILSIYGCSKLRSIPPLELASIEQLDISFCGSLESFPPVVRLLDKLKILRAKKCRKLRSFPPLKMPSLEELDLSICVSLDCFPSLDGLLGKLKILRAKECRKLGSFPPLKIPSLEELDLSNCVSLDCFPSVDGLLGKLKILSVYGCTKLRSIPPLNLASLEQLNISCCDSLESFPPVVGLLDKLKILHAKDCRKLRSFPPFKTASLEELDLSNCVSLDCFPSVDGLLGKLKILSVYGCSKLRSIPLLNLALLEQLSISCCDSLESFPKLLGELENITQPCLNDTPIMELSFSFENRTRLQILYLKKWGIVQLPSSFVVMPELTKLTIEGGRCLFPKQEEGEEKVSPMQFSQVEFLSLRKCNLSDGSLAIGLKWFANVKELYLSGSRFTILPECIEKCQFLWKLFLDNCEELQEIKGIPPSLKTFCSLNCQSLTSSSKSKLLKQELHEAGNTWFRLPRAKIPEWFDHQTMEGLSISFWFRNKFPAIALCVVSPLTWRYIKNQEVSVIINGNRVFYRAHVENNHLWPETYHLHLFHMQMERFDDNLDRALLENKWNHVEVHLFAFQKSRIHVLKEKSEMKDIRFTNPEL